MNRAIGYQRASGIRDKARIHGEGFTGEAASGNESDAPLAGFEDFGTLWFTARHVTSKKERPSSRRPCL
jgi:hypothetical protein